MGDSSAAASESAKREAELVSQRQAAIESNPAIAGLTKDIQIERGKKVYLSVCFACHLADGKGLPAVFPPLAGSDFLKADTNRAIRIVTKGLTGPVVVNGATFNNVMPPHESALSQDQIADVLTFVMNSFGNDLGTISTADVKRVQNELK